MPMLGSRAAAALRNWGFTRILSTVVPRLTDLYYRYVTLLIRAKNGSAELNGTTATAARGFNSDSSANLAQLNINGDVKPFAASPYQVGFYSNQFVGAGTDYITGGAAYPGSSISSFTIECWIYMTGAPLGAGGNLVGDMNTPTASLNYSSWGPASTRILNFYWFTGTPTNCNGSTAMALNRWYHIAISVNANAIKMFVNGVAETLSGTTTLSNRSSTTSTIAIGAYNSTNYFAGYISNLRIISGYALYNANFTPPVAPLTALPGTTLLTCQSYTIEDRGPIRYALTKGGNTYVRHAHPFTPTYTAAPTNTSYSMYFDGTGDNLNIANSSQFDFGTGDFTIEFWLYAINMPNAAGIIGKKTGDATNGWQIYHNTSVANTRLSIRTTLQNDFSSTSSWTLGVWEHWAVARSGGTIRWFKNGILDNSAASAYNITDTALTYLGYSQTWGGYYTGYISNLRIVTGSALYTSSFIPSTTPLSAVTGTSLLTCQDAVPKDNSTNNFSITTAGDVRAGQFHPFTQYTTAVVPAAYSTYFDGNGDYLSMPATPVFNIPTNTTPLTFECWVFLNSSATQNYIFSEIYTGAGNSIPIYIGFNNGSTSTPDTVGLYPVIGYYSGSAWSVAAVANTPITTNGWFHLAFVFTGSATSVYINGINRTTAGFATTWGGALNNNGDGWYIGKRWDATGVISGYIRDFRFVKGKAVYTGNFAPPTAQLGLTQAAGTNITALTNTIPTNGYSAYFNGSSDYVTVYRPGGWLNTSAWTLEAWFNLTSVTAAAVASPFGNSNTSNQGWEAGFNQSGGVYNSWYFYWKASASGQSFNYAFALNTWYHIAIVNDGSGSNNFKQYLNGVLMFTSTYANVTDLTTINIGQLGYPGYNYWYPGYISNLRITSQAVYTSAFTPSTTPLTAVPGTILLTFQSLELVDNSGTVGITRYSNASPAPYSPFGSSDVLMLTCQDNIIKDNAGGMFFTINGDARPSATTVSPLLPTTGYDTTLLSCAYFDGTGDYIDLATGTWSPMGSADFTIELWVYPTAAPATNWTPFMTMGFSGGAAEIRISQNINATGFGFLVPSNTAATDAYAGYGTMAINQWHHLALSRIGTTVTLYRNGVAAGSQTGLTFNHTANNLFRIGGSQAAYPDGLYTGYIADLRIVRRYSVYKTSFTPPVQPLSTAVNSPGVTTLLALQQSGTMYNNFFNDTGIGNAVVTRTGDAHPGTFSPYGPGWSTHFDGSTGYLTAPASTLYNFGTGDFTIEFWLYYIGGTSRVVTNRATGGAASGTWSVSVNSTIISFTEVVIGESGPSATVANMSYTWVHIAVARASGVTKIFLNGTQVASAAQTTNFNNSSYTLWICTSPTESYINGYVSNLHIVNGTALYTNSFTPSTLPITATTNTVLLTLQDSWLLDNSKNRTKLTAVGTTRFNRFNPFNNYQTTPATYSAYLNGSTDSLSISQTVSLPTATTPFTIEAWVYFTAFTGIAIASNAYSSGAIPFVAGMGSGQASAGSTPWFGYYNGSSWVTVVQSATSLVTGTWYHMAYVYTATTATIYVNGVSVGSAAATTWQTTAGTAGFYIGRRWDTFAGVYHSGYISNFRFTIGRAVYTATFTPGTAPLTAIPGTLMLACQSRVHADNGPNNYTITPNGTPAVSEFNPFVSNVALADTYPTTTGTSVYFDGSGDYLDIPTSATTAFGTSDFTIECWVYPVARSTIYPVIICNFTAWGANGWQLTERHNNNPSNFSFYSYNINSAAAILVSTTTVANGAWYHVAIQRSGSTFRMYVNGISEATATSATAVDGGSTHILRTGYGDASTTALNGYISNLRVLKQAIYSGNFMPARSIQKTAGEIFALNPYTTGIVDSNANHTIETLGDVKLNQRIGGPYGTNYSVLFNGSNNYLTVPSTTTLNFGTADFTVEAWINLTNTTTSKVIVSGSAATSFGFRYGNGYNGASGLGIYKAATADCEGCNFSFFAATWYHVAVVRQSAVIKFFVNGVQQITTGSGAASFSYPAETNVRIGTNDPANGEWFGGYISNVRVTKSAIYTSSFAPSTIPLTASGSALLTCQNSRFIDNSGNALVPSPTNAPNVAEFNPFSTSVVSNSLYFDGTGDFLLLPYNDRLHILQGDFTVELWFNSLSTAANQVIIGQWLQTTNNGGYAFGVGSSTLFFSFGAISEGAAAITASATYVLGVWNHAAIVRSGSVFTLYQNGVSVGTTTSSNTRGMLAINTILGNYYSSGGSVPATGANYFNGYLADLRITKYARYTAAFIPPTAELPATA